MPDNALNTAAPSDLNTLREEFAKAQADIKQRQEKLPELEKKIAAAERVIAEEKRKTALQQIIAGDNADVLKGRSIEFLINNTKEGGTKEGSALPAAVRAAYKVYKLVTSAGVQDAKVSVDFWGSSYPAPMKLDTQFGATAFNATKASAREFLPVAKKVLTENTPDVIGDKTKNYVIICNTSVSDDVAHAATILEAASKLNPKATFDFVVVGAEASNIGALVKKWGEISSGQKPNLVQVAEPKDLAAAVLNIVKARTSGSVYTQPAPAAKAAAPSSPAA